MVISVVFPQVEIMQMKIIFMTTVQSKDGEIQLEISK